MKISNKTFNVDIAILMFIALLIQILVTAIFPIFDQTEFLLSVFSYIYLSFFVMTMGILLYVIKFRSNLKILFRSALVVFGMVIYTLLYILIELETIRNNNKVIDIYDNKRYISYSDKIIDNILLGPGDFALLTKNGEKKLVIVTKKSFFKHDFMRNKQNSLYELNTREIEIIPKSEYIEFTKWVQQKQIN